jgi:hypothetical protein
MDVIKGLVVTAALAVVALIVAARSFGRAAA